jgi:hypothetical protein
LPREAKIEMNHLAGAARRDGHAFYGICAVELRRALALGCYKTAWLLQLRRNLGTGRRPFAGLIKIETEIASCNMCQPRGFCR